MEEPTAAVAGEQKEGKISRLCCALPTFFDSCSLPEAPANPKPETVRMVGREAPDEPGSKLSNGVRHAQFPPFASGAPRRAWGRSTVPALDCNRRCPRPLPRDLLAKTPWLGWEVLG